MGQGLLNYFWPQSPLLLVGMVLVSAILTDSFKVDSVNVEPNTAVLNEGDPTYLLCTYTSPIVYCRIEIPGEEVLNLSPDWSTGTGFSYYGRGFSSGQCGVTINHVKAINNGVVNCSLGIEGRELRNAMELVVALRPQQPTIEVVTQPERDGYYMEGRQFRARCIVRDGRPAANISWYLNDMPAAKSTSQLEVEASRSDHNMLLSTTKQEIHWRLGPDDNGRKLICRSHHQTDRESIPPQEADFHLVVRFAPVKQQEIFVYGLYPDHTALINVTIRANPAPMVELNIDSVVIGQGRKNGRYVVYEPRYLGEDYYNITVAIDRLTLEDTRRSYQLRAFNAYGTTDYTLRISSASTPPIAGLDIGAIVGIVVAVAILIVLIALIVFAKATGRWCFGGKSVKGHANETGPGGQGARIPGQSVALLETPNGVTIIGNRHADTTSLPRPATGDHDATHGGDEQTLAVQRRRHSQAPPNDDDVSFEYSTDRESSVYNATTRPLRAVIAAAGGRNSQKSPRNDDEGRTAVTAGGDLLTRGNQLGIPESRFTRWIPKDQREILEKQAKLLANHTHAKTPEAERADQSTAFAPHNRAPTASDQDASQQETDI